MKTDMLVSHSERCLIESMRTARENTQASGITPELLYVTLERFVKRVREWEKVGVVDKEYGPCMIEVTHVDSSHIEIRILR